MKIGGDGGGAGGENKCQIEWCDTEGPLPYEEKDLDIQVLFIGGGNAYVLFRSRSLCTRVNQMMSRYILEHAYSLRLAVAICEKRESFADDYKNLQRQMRENRDSMMVSKLSGTVPVMKEELKTGFPATMIDPQSEKDIGKEIGEETNLKQKAYARKREAAGDSFKKEEQIFDNLVTQKGVDSRLAVVHIDGNSMGVRIRRIVEGIQDYTEAVNKMREISFQITKSYRDTFQKMHDYFTDRPDRKEFRTKRANTSCGRFW